MESHEETKVRNNGWCRKRGRHEEIVRVDLPWGLH
jgi:hypothetical protein